MSVKSFFTESTPGPLQKFNINQTMREKYTRSVVWVVLIWGIGDTLSTYIAIAAFGSIDYEINPLLRELMHINPLLLIVAKLIAVGSVAILAMKGKKYITAVSGWQYYFYFVIISGVVVTGLNFYAAFTEVTSHESIFAFFF